MNTELTAAVIEYAPDAIVVSDLDGVITVWNAAATALFGFSADEALGANLDLIIPERFRAAHWAGFKRAIESGRTKYLGRVMTTRATHADGRKLYIDMGFGMMHGPDGAMIGVVATARPNVARNEAAAGEASG